MLGAFFCLQSRKVVAAAVGNEICRSLVLHSYPQPHVCSSDVNLITSRKLFPAELVESLLQMSRDQLEDQPLGALVLIVQAPADDEDGEFVEKLVSSVLRDAPLSGESQRWPMTSEFPTVARDESPMVDADEVKLLSELLEAPHVVVPLLGVAKRNTLLIGRGPQCSIPLLDPSVSSEHARFLLKNGGVRIEDAASKNGTRLNDRRLEVGEGPWLQPMDRLSFGRIQAFACDPRALRAVLRQDLRSLV